jgi:hypothetical protein
VIQSEVDAIFIFKSEIKFVLLQKPDGEVIATPPGHRKVDSQGPAFLFV